MNKLLKLGENNITFSDYILFGKHVALTKDKIGMSTSLLQYYIYYVRANSHGQPVEIQTSFMDLHDDRTDFYGSVVTNEPLFGEASTRTKFIMLDDDDLYEDAERKQYNVSEITSILSSNEKYQYLRYFIRHYADKNDVFKSKPENAKHIIWKSKRDLEFITDFQHYKDKIEYPFITVEKWNKWYSLYIMEGPRDFPIPINEHRFCPVPKETSIYNLPNESILYFLYEFETFVTEHNHSWSPQELIKCCKKHSVYIGENAFKAIVNMWIEQGIAFGDLEHYLPSKGEYDKVVIPDNEDEEIFKYCTSFEDEEYEAFKYYTEE